MTGEGLSPAARVLLDAARGGMAPDAATVARMKAKVGSAAASTASTAITIKLALVALVATLAAGTAIYGNRSRSMTPPSIELPAAHHEAFVPVAQIRADSPTGDAAIEIEPMPRPNATATLAIPPTAALVRETGDASAPTAAKGRADLAREVELVDLAMAALRRGDSTSALAAIRTHSSETRDAGQLAEDAAAIEIEVLCRRHDPSVVAKLDAFDARFPRSAQRSRLSATCP